MILENSIKQAKAILKKNDIVSYELDAEILLSNILGVSKEFLLLNSNIDISNEIQKKYYEAINRRAKKEPVAYIIGKKEFWSQDFIVNKATLIPRPETELLIYYVVDFFKDKKINILDIGTGTGCILLSILKELVYSKGIGIDVSAKAIKIANLNANKFNLSNRSKFKIFNINKFNFGKYDLIVSNPPYIKSRDIKNLSEDIANYEPAIALNGGLNGLDLIKKIIYKSNILLKKNGLFAIEIGNRQYKEVSDLLRKFKFREMTRVYDCGYNVRCIISTKV